MADSSPRQCTGANKQWDSVDQCVATLTQKPMGTFDNLWGDNVWCRALHVRLTPLRPDVSQNKMHLEVSVVLIVSPGSLRTRRPRWRRQVRRRALQPGLL